MGINTDLAPWLQASKLSFSPDLEGSLKGAFSADIIVVGAGIAGASAAFEFAEAGFNVLVLEKENEVASLGSGNLQGMLYLKLSPHLTYQNDLITFGFEKTLSVLNQLTNQGLLVKGVDWDNPGLLQLETSIKQAGNQAKLADRYPESLMYKVDQAKASQLAGIPLTAGGLFFPQSGWVSPPAFVRALLAHSNITIKTGMNVIEMQQLNTQIKEASVPHWEIVIESGIKFQSKVVVLAMADRVTDLSICESIPFTVVRGQTTTVKSESHLNIVVSGEGYIAPSKIISGEAFTTFGATFHRDKTGGDPTFSEHLENIAMLKQNSPVLVERLGLADLDESTQGVKEGVQLEGRAATRASAMGSLPIVGPIANRSLFLKRFDAIRLDAKAIPDEIVPWEEGIYLTTAHGSRGMITASISAEILKEYVLGTIEKSRFSQALLGAIHPNRFFYRELRFGQ